MPNYMDTLTPTEREITRYLLGDVTDDERDRIGEQSVIDLAHGELVEMLELALTEAYVRSNLTEGDRVLFERRFLVTKERVEKLLVLRAICSRNVTLRHEV
jgi:hypothetical protein